MVKLGRYDHNRNRVPRQLVDGGGRGRNKQGTAEGARDGAQVNKRSGKNERLVRSQEGRSAPLALIQESTDRTTDRTTEHDQPCETGS